jgi:hypothetical protein
VSTYLLTLNFFFIINSYRPSDDHIEKFEVETMGTCAAMIKRYDEMTEEEALTKKYRNGRVPYTNYETNENGYM